MDVDWILCFRVGEMLYPYLNESPKVQRRRCESAVTMQGVSLVSISIAIALIGIVLAMGGAWLAREAQVRQAYRIGSELKALATATERLLKDHRSDVDKAWSDAMQRGQSKGFGSRHRRVNVNPDGQCAMQLSAGEVIAHQRLTAVRATPPREGSFVIRVTATGCSSADHRERPLGILVYWDRPLKTLGPGRPDSPVIAAALSAGGIHAGVSLDADPSWIRFGAAPRDASTHNAIQNPVPNSPAGIIAVRAHLPKPLDDMLMHIDGSKSMRGPLWMGNQVIKGINELHTESVRVDSHGLRSADTSKISIHNASVSIENAKLRSNTLGVRSTLTASKLVSDRLSVDRVDARATLTLGERSSVHQRLTLGERSSAHQRGRVERVVVKNDFEQSGTMTVEGTLKSARVEAKRPFIKAKRPFLERVEDRADISGRNLVSTKGVVELRGDRERWQIDPSCDKPEISSQAESGKIRVCVPGKTSRTLKFE